MNMKEYSAGIRNLIKHENELVSHRIGWLMTTQSLLYIALGLVWQQGMNSVILIALVGILSCASFGYVLSFTDDAIGLILEKYRERLKQEGNSENDYPPVIGFEGCTGKPFLPWNFLPWLHTIAWSLLVLLRSYEV